MSHVTRSVKMEGAIWSCQISVNVSILMSGAVIYRYVVTRKRPPPTKYKNQVIAWEL